VRPFFCSTLEAVNGVMTDRLFRFGGQSKREPRPRLRQVKRPDPTVGRVPSSLSQKDQEKLVTSPS
jgi:hypothetical protein